MGLLDDAIRQHLELKRLHGADPQEVARQEDEALGAIGGHDAAAAEPVEAEIAAEAAPPADEIEIEEPPVPYEPPAPEVEAAEPEPPPVAPEPAEEPEFDVQQPTIEFSVEDDVHEDAPAAAEERPPAPAEAEPAEPADELEETPEFLQETPEHDRLWFEQKPPRDFDF
jgi:hypothetical protein